MTIAIAVKVAEGIILGSDSAATRIQPDRETGTPGLLALYNSATKIFRLHEDLPIGMVTWGAGAIFPHPVSLLADDFRTQVMGTSSFDPSKYTIKEVAQELREFMYKQHFQKSYTTSVPEDSDMGFMVAGYSSGESFGEVWKILIQGGSCGEPQQVIAQEKPGYVYEGAREPLDHLLSGFEEVSLRNVLNEPELGLNQDTIGRIIQLCFDKLGANILTGFMPIQDAIDLAVFLAETAIGYTRFNPGVNSVGGPVDIAVITRHRGFSWVRGKWVLNY